MKQNHLPLIGVVADDLTSATDGAAPFLEKGYSPLITRTIDGPIDRAVVSIDTNSRALDIGAAVKATADGVTALSNARFIFKTIDSTLRGYILLEILAAFHASGRDRIIVAPAFPEAGRLTVNGIQTVYGVPVSESDYGSDPVHPAKTSCVADLIHHSLGDPVVLAQDGSSDITGSRVVILDAGCQETLNRQVASIPDPETVLWVGSPGLAIALASMVAPTVDEDVPETRDASRRVLIVGGSANPVTHAQCDTLLDKGIPIVTDIADAPWMAASYVFGHRQNVKQIPKAVLEAIVEQATAALDAPGYEALIATGGETMGLILERLNISRFVLIGELEPGFPVGYANRPDRKPLIIAMKAGGFGTPSTLLHAARSLSGQALSRKVLADDRS